MTGVDQVPMFEDLEVDNPEGAKKRREIVNCLQEILNELMDKRGVEAADIHRATGIPHTTIHDWINGNVHAQITDKNLLKVGRYFNVCLYYLLYGIGSDEPYFKEFDEESEQDKLHSLEAENAKLKRLLRELIKYLMSKNAANNNNKNGR